MPIKLRFLGAAQNVTGSKYLLETDNTRVLVDCGLYQERDFKSRNWEAFPVQPSTIDTVLLTHAHIDHCGLLPKLVREGFKGKIYSTAATSDITEIMLLDSAKLHQEDAEFKKKRHQREGRQGPYPEVPLYTIVDAQNVFPLLSPVKYEETIPLADGVRASFHEAGHVLGSSMIKIIVSQGKEERTIIFSGDIGTRNKPILRDRATFEAADYIIVESTYGDRLHEKSGDIGDNLARVINSTRKAGGNVVIPSFALERTQDILYYLHELRFEKRIPPLMIFVDSPMAVNITEIFERYPELYDKEMTEVIQQHQSPFDFLGLEMVKTVEESKAINNIDGTTLIIAGSGMCTGGRIKHHLVTNISRKESTILFVGYQANGTLGRHLVNGAKKVKILGQQYKVRAKVAQINGFSAHADRDGLLRWLSGFKKAPRHLFVTHGESQAATYFGELVREKTGWETSVPEYLDEAILE
ncbi:MBL fold metallo-hydrolase RNA specificity domain-containing protein [Chloroflexota bacterium]